MKRTRILALALLAILAMPSQAFAEGFALYEWSARGVALGGATMARTPDPSVIASNPAAMTRLEGIQVQGGASLVMPYGKMKFDSGETYKLKDEIWPVPNFYYTHQLNDKFTFGIGEFSRFGLGFTYPGDWKGKYNIYEVSVVSASLNPNLAYKVTDKLSVAGGVEFMYVDITLKKKVPSVALGLAPALGDIDFDNNAKNMEHAWNLALHYQFNEQWAAGVSYRSKLKHVVHGHLKTDKGVPNQDFYAKVYMPESLSFGLSYAPTPKLSVEAGAVWTHWSQFTDLDFTFSGDLGLKENKKYWQNTWRFNLGVEYALNDWVDLRAGYVFDGCPVPDAREDYLIPTNDRHIYSIGAGFKVNNWTIDTAYAFVDPVERSYQPGPYKTGVLASKTKDSGTHIVSLSVGYKF